LSYQFPDDLYEWSRLEVGFAVGIIGWAVVLIFYFIYGIFSGTKKIYDQDKMVFWLSALVGIIVVIVFINSPKE